MKLKTKEPNAVDPNRPYPEGIAWDEALRQRRRADRLVEMLREAGLQIEYLHGKFSETGSGNAVLAQISYRLENQYAE